MSITGLTPQGYSAPRLADLLAEWRTQIGTAAPDLATDDDTLLGVIATAVLEQAALLAEQTQQVYDAFDPATARGANLDSMAAILGATRRPATPARVTIDLSGTSATMVPAGTLYADALGNQFSQEDPAVLDGSGDATIQAAAVVPGRLSFAAADVDQIVTPVAGLASAVGSAVVTLGTDVETDAELRARRLEGSQALGRGTLPAMRSRLQQVPEIESVSVETDRIAHTYSVTLFPTLADPDVLDRIARVLWETQPMGIESLGTESASVVLQRDATVVDTVRWSWATPLAWSAQVLVERGPDYPPGGDALVRAAVAAYASGLRVGEAVRRLPILCRVSQIQGVRAASVTFKLGATWAGPATPAPGDLEVSPGTIAVLDANNLTAAVAVGTL